MLLLSSSMPGVCLRASRAAVGKMTPSCCCRARVTSAFVPGCVECFREQVGGLGPRFSPAQSVTRLPLQNVVMFRHEVMPPSRGNKLRCAIASNFVLRHPIQGCPTDLARRKAPFSGLAVDSAPCDLPVPVLSSSCCQGRAGLRLLAGRAAGAEARRAASLRPRVSWLSTANGRH